MKRKIRFNPNLRKSQRGDTLVSVALSIAAVSLVMVITYIMITQGVRTGQRAREREQIKNLVQGQIEGLKSLAFKNDSDVAYDIFQFEEADQFCLAKNTDTTDMITDGNLYILVLNSTATHTYMGTHDQCENFASLKASNFKIHITYDAEDLMVIRAWMGMKRTYLRLQPSGIVSEAEKMEWL